MALEYALFALLGFAASLVSAVFGFGAALLVLAVGPYILPVREVMVLAAALFLASTVTKSVLYRHAIDWRLVLLMALGSLPFSWFGAMLMTETPADWLRRLLGVMVLAWLVVNRFGISASIQLERKGLLAGAALYGFVSGVIGSGNLVKVILFREIRMSAAAFVGAMAATSVMANIVKCLVFYQAGIYRSDHVLPVWILIVCAVIAAVMGKYVLTRISNKKFESGLQLVLAVSAIGLLY